MGEKVVLCDTNVLINWFNCEELTVKVLTEIGLKNILISSITIMELVNHCGNKNELRRLNQRIDSYDILDFNENISKLATRFFNDYKLSTNLDIPDAIIGASAIVFNIPLFTYNDKDFKFLPGIILYAYGKN
jgi:predicted nucleic acid-binding protein